MTKTMKDQMNSANAKVWADTAFQKTVEKALITTKRIGANFPHASQKGTYVLEDPAWWTAGFWPGLLWVLYEGSGEETFRNIAEQCEEQLDKVLDGYDRLDHDIGFMWTLTSLANYKLQGGEVSRRRAFKAANYLMARFNLKGNYIRAWNPWTPQESNTGLAIIDCSMNVPLLYWASRESGDPRYAHVANAHMNTVVDHFIRPDGSVRHIVRFDPDTGEVAEYIGGQGYAPESAWSRGNAWALYGLALTYHHTGNSLYLNASKQTAHFFLSQLLEDAVPAWDFRAPEESRHLKDSSAGACAACGLLLLSTLVPESEGATYQRAGERILESLYTSYSTFDHPEEEGLIMHGTSHYPHQQNVDVPLIYGDYFFVEGLARLKGNHHIFWE
ncbi:glycoside hydrolase family 88 protein [Paenibacillus sp. Marseille-Q4541]|uniref:glycoside hydrolase family 88 protein n=1 Tax=Paenibacillus sp. Marseille-Q4541 TaxID=2831522 RepID=UPI00201A0270|nr:glycoside hydrolase family 88 protein [Paenibacillus sp. Marseille-Q4541]